MTNFTSWNRFFLFIDGKENFFAVSAENLREARRNARLLDREARELFSWSFDREELPALEERFGVETFLFPCEDE